MTTMRGPSRLRDESKANHYVGNHLGYRQSKGTKTSAEEISDLYTGLKQSHLTDFDIMLTGYAPNAEAVDAIGAIGRDLKLKASTRTGSFFWGASSNTASILLSEVEITSPSDLIDAITRLHKNHRIPHIIVTSVRFDPSSPVIYVVGSTSCADGSPRLFKIDVPAIDCFFSGTGDMFAALTVVRLREAVSDEGLSATKSWRSPDDVDALDLPLAKATEKVLGSMHTILEKTKLARDAELEKMSGPQGAFEKDSEKRIHLRKTKAAEVRLVRNLADLRWPAIEHRAQALGTRERWNSAKIRQPTDQPE
ncbi:MAG: hypothetical protein Q9200_000991 [Gallowayella weberi]